MTTPIPESGAKDPIKLWINDTWYIPIDKKGRVQGICAEGALGFVIQLQSDRNPKFHKALKIPRLMGETRRENAYINELAEKELRAVEQIFNIEGERSCLLVADAENGSLIRGPISIQSGSEEAQQWNGALVLVYYEKGQDPTFCLVKFDNNKISYWPAETDCPVVEATIYEKIKSSAKEKGDWAHTVFIDSGEVQESGHKGNLNILSVDEALKSDSTERTWYTCLPSIMYNWAPVTLQESISRRQRGGSWDKGKHLILIERICRGLVALHGRGMLHADVRPANIVREGEPSNPHSYSLSDYGSFADPGARAGGRNHIPGQTVLGPVVSGERISAFYAPERRQSTELEAANTAVIYNPGSTSLYVILGWASDLIDPVTEKPKDSLMEFVKNDLSETHENGGPRNLVEGDRIQVREYIFDVQKEWHTKDRQILKCNSRFWKIYHGRIVVESRDKFQPLDSFPISRTVELEQWQAATDLFSLGALALYSVFCDSVDKQREESIDNSGDRGRSENKTNENHNSIEDDFRQMLRYLESPAYFNSIWPELEWMRKEIENHLDETGLTEKDLADQKFTPYDPVIKLEKKEGNLKGALVALVGRITQSVPGAKEVVEALDYDLGTFIFFIHFVLCCLHRQSDVNVSEEWEWMKVEEYGPFAKDRLEKPEKDGAAAKALKRIERIRDIIQDRLLSGLKLEPPTKEEDPIPKFDPRPTSVIRADLDRTKAELNQTKTDLEQAETDLGQAEKSLKSFETAVDSVLKTPWRIFQNLKKLQKAKEDKSS